jgi:hypothetical protein
MAIKAPPRLAVAVAVPAAMACKVQTLLQVVTVEQLIL